MHIYEIEILLYLFGALRYNPFMITTSSRSVADGGNEGFTLVELSIVLVIIGLLIGGILVGQSLIESAKLYSFTQQIGQYDIALSNFKTKYKSLPGDSRFLNPPGDGDGFIEDTRTEAGTHNFATYFNNELANFWMHLQQSGLTLPFTANNDAGTGIKTKIHIPEVGLGKSSNGVKPGVYLRMGRASEKNSRYWHICDWSKTTTATNVDNAALRANSFTPAEAYAIDNKIDDGNPDNTSSDGTIIGIKELVGATNRNDNFTGGNAGNRCWDGTNNSLYRVDSPNIECCVMIRMFGLIGE